MTESAGEPQGHAPGHPGIGPTWTSSAKDIVGTSLGRSRIWFTLGFGIVNEVYYPRVDSPQIRDLGFIIGDGRGFWVEIKRLQNYTVRLLAPGTPAVEVVHSHKRFTLTLRVTPDPSRDVLLIALRLAGDEELKAYALLAPRLGMDGRDNTTAVTRFGSRRLLAASHGSFGLALAATSETREDAFGGASAGYVGTSDGWQDFHLNGALTWQYADAGPGNVALIGEVARTATLGLGFGDNTQAAATLAVSSLMEPFDAILTRQMDDWKHWHAKRNERALLRPDPSADLADQLFLSSMVLRTHRDRTYPGTMVASLSVPWGNSRDDRGGYHLVWPRDLVQCATALLALGAEREARDTLAYLIATQKEDGSWNQNQWLDGTPYWEGIQLDEVAFPVLLAAALAERDALHGMKTDDMIRRALGFIVRSGPSSSQDRWEENAGISVYTLSVCIAALIAGAPFLENPARAFATAVADFWNTNIEMWTSVSGSALAKRYGVEAHYIRIAPADVLDHPSSLGTPLDLKNSNPDRQIPADEEISVDFLQLVRLGLRSADDALIRSSLIVADALLKCDTANGSAWRRYNGDGYGEHDDGRPFDGAGRGRAWPLLTGERGHYELAAGNDPTPYLTAMAAMTGPGGMMPEQVWDAAPIPELRLIPGKPTGSAMPLAWTHAEFIKLMVSRHIGHPVDRPSVVWTRYGGHRPAVACAIWCLHAPIVEVGAGMPISIALPRPALIHWGVDGWRNPADEETTATGLGLHACALDAQAFAGAHAIDFTIQWCDTRDWIGQNFRIHVQR